MKLKRLCRYCVIKVWMCFGSFLKQLPLLCLPGTALSAEELKDFQSLRILLQAAPSEPCLDPPLGKTPLEPGPSESPSSFSASSNAVFFKAVSTLWFKCQYMNIFLFKLTCSRFWVLYLGSQVLLNWLCTCQQFLLLHPLLSCILKILTIFYVWKLLESLSKCADVW